MADDLERGIEILEKALARKGKKVAAAMPESCARAVLAAARRDVESRAPKSDTELQDAFIYDSVKELQRIQKQRHGATWTPEFWEAAGKILNLSWHAVRGAYVRHLRRIRQS